MANVDIEIKVRGVKEAIKSIQVATRHLAKVVLIMNGWPRWVAHIVAHWFPYSVMRWVVEHYGDKDDGRTD